MRQQLIFAYRELLNKRRLTRSKFSIPEWTACRLLTQLLADIVLLNPKADNSCYLYSVRQGYAVTVCIGGVALAIKSLTMRCPRRLPQCDFFAQMSVDKDIPDRTTIMNFSYLLKITSLKSDL